MVLKDLRTPDMVAVAAVPVFPGRRAGRGGQWKRQQVAGRAAVYGGVRGRAGEHARDVWDRHRAVLVRQAGALEREAGGRAGLLATVEIEFLSRISVHVLDCGVDGCADWQAWAVGQVPGLRGLWRALGGEWASVPPGYARALSAVLRGP